MIPAETLVTCARPGCTNTVTHRPSDRRKREYCSNQCRQKAYRLRKRPQPKRNDVGVTISSYDQMLTLLDSLTTEQLNSLQEHIGAHLHQRTKEYEPEPTAPFLYFRGRTGVVHLAVSKNVAICGRETTKMEEVQLGKTDRICRYCANTRDRGTWWKRWRTVFGDGDDESKP